MLNESSMAVFEKDFEEYTFNAILDSKHLNYVEG